ncbi:hypothetical protein DV515_00007316 [Chloebia gouldiae]|uniref:Uncharacterized protein n=1 Tax=Chloebia gouldiae TaxID=44316 RepID=A0A3L8SHH2_CHLGU|nr:hypothetical protein DV515_00007316 [Chloebia gouldiae]
MLMKQQDRLEEREQDIEEQLYKLESDKRLVEEKVSQLKDEVRLQYEKMHQILDEDLRKTMEILDKAQAKFCNENAAQVLHLNERMQEAKKLLSSVQVMFDKTEDINFMKGGTGAVERFGCVGRIGYVWGVVGSRMGTIAGLADAQQWKKPRSEAGSVLASNEKVPQLEMGLEQPMGERGLSAHGQTVPSWGPWKLTMKGGMATMAGIGLTDQSFSFHFQNTKSVKILMDR